MIYLEKTQYKGEEVEKDWSGIKKKKTILGKYTPLLFPIFKLS